MLRRWYRRGAMDENLSSSARVPRELLRRIMVRRDGPGVLRLAVQAATLVAAGAWTCRLAAEGSPWWWVGSTLCGLALVGGFPLLHESGHGTAFRAPLLNRVGMWWGALTMLQSPTFFKEFHWEHHRQTQHPARDPEVMMAPWLLGRWPQNPVIYFMLATGQALLSGKLMFTAACALLPSGLWRRLFPYVRAAQARRVAWESRLVLALLVGAVWAGWTLVPGFWALLLAWPIGHVFLGLYLLPEHTGLPEDGSQIHRTRTLVSSPLLRWWMWNMPYHAEHHAYPAVPFHALPELHRALAPELEHVLGGYLQFHAQALLRSLRGA